MGDAKDKGLKDDIVGAAANLQGLVKPLLDGLTVAIPVLMKYWKKGQEVYATLPKNILSFAVGFIFAFFGGMYPVLFAATMAAEYGGRQIIYTSLKDLADEAIIILEQSKKDDQVDDDKDGVSDVDQISSQEYIKRKTLLVLQKMNPDKVDSAIKAIYGVWISVAAVLSLQFAQVISFAIVIADFLKRPVDRFIAPTVQIAVPDQYDKWVPVVLTWIAKAIGMSIAWYIAAIRAAFASALKGGLMMSRALYQELIERKIDLGGLIPMDHSKSNIDELMSYGFAFLGFYFQYKCGFTVPFPLSLLLFPINIAEYMIRWSITQ